MMAVQTTANLVQDTLMILPADHTHRKHQIHIHGKQPLIDPSIRRKSLFKTHSQTLPQNWMMTLIL